VIHCEKCKQRNPGDAQKCSQCGANLLPGISFKARVGIALICIIGGPLLALILRALFHTGEAPSGLLDLVEGMFVLLSIYALAPIVVLFGIYWLLRITPKMERYQQRGKRHMTLDPRQAIADFSAVVDLYSKKHKETINLSIRETWIMRGDMYKEIGMLSEARNDYNRALDLINKEIDRAVNRDPEALKVWKSEQKEVHRLLGSLTNTKLDPGSKPSKPKSDQPMKEKVH
jgi:hypothetical protein